MNKKSDKDIRKFIIICLMVTVVFMSTAFAVYAERLNIEGVGTITGEWNINISSVETIELHGGAYNISEPTFDNTKVSFNAGLKANGDYIIYEIIVQNEGTLDAILNAINVSEANDVNASKVIKYELLGDSEGTPLPQKVGSTVSTNSIKVKVYYDDSGVDASYVPLNTSKAISIILSYVQA